MPYLIVTYDKPDHGRLRQQTRPEHLTFLESNKAKLLACGAKLRDLKVSRNTVRKVLRSGETWRGQRLILNAAAMH